MVSKEEESYKSSKHFCYFNKKNPWKCGKFFGNFAKNILTMLLGVSKIGKWQIFPTRKSLGWLHPLRRRKKEEKITIGKKKKTGKEKENKNAKENKEKMKKMKKITGKKKKNKNRKKWGEKGKKRRKDKAHPPWKKLTRKKGIEN